MKLFPSTVIVCQNQLQGQKKISQICQSLGHESTDNNPDVFFINSQTGWTINLVRTLKKFISQKPFNHKNKIVLISEAHNLNIESQNALLKTLEEPEENNYLILSTNQPAKLLNTVISRCHLIKLKNNLDNKINPIEKKIQLTQNFTKDSTALNKLYQNKEQILPFLQQQLLLFQQDLIKNPSKQSSNTIQTIIKAINMIKANVDPRSALDYIFLS